MREVVLEVSFASRQLFNAFRTIDLRIFVKTRRTSFCVAEGCILQFAGFAMDLHGKQEVL